MLCATPKRIQSISRYKETEMPGSLERQASQIRGAIVQNKSARIRDSIMKGRMSDSGIVMVDGTFFGDSFEQDRSWDDSGTTISGI